VACLGVSSEREEKLLEDLLTRYQTLGIVVWGEIEDAPGTYAKILVKSDGTVKVEGTTTVSGDVNVTDRWSRQLGQVDLARVLGAALSVTNPVIAGIYDALGNRMPSMDSALRPGYIDMIDKAARLVGIVYGSQSQQLQQRASTYELLVAIRQAGSELSTNNPIFAGIVDASGNRMPSMDASNRPGYVDVIDRVARLLGVVYGSQAQQLLQRALTYELLATIRQGGSELSTSNPIFAGIVDASGNRMPSMDASTRPGYVDVIDRAARLLGVVYGSQAQQLQQKASTYELLVDVVDRAARQLGLVYGSQNQILQQKASTYELLTDPVDRAARLLGIVYGSLGQLQQRATSLDLYAAIRQGGSELSTSNPLFVGLVDALGNRMPSMDSASRPGYIDVIDRAARLLGVVYGSQSQQLLQRASTYEALVTIRQAGSELSASNPIFSSITDVTKVSTPHYYTPTALGAGGTGTIWTPEAGKKIRLKRVQISVNAQTQIDLRFATTAFESYFLPANGSVVVNFVGTNREGAINEALTLRTVSAATVTASADGDEI